MQIFVCKNRHFFIVIYLFHIIIIINNIFRRLLFSFTYTCKSYLKKAVIKHDIINHTQTKLIIHV